jgi:hypothetical protein
MVTGIATASPSKPTPASAPPTFGFGIPIRNPARVIAMHTPVTRATQRSWLRSTSRERRNRTTTEPTAKRNTRISPTPKTRLELPMTAEIEPTPMGLGTFGRWDASCVVAVVTMDPATSTTATAVAPRAAHRHRGVGSLPFGKKKTREMSRKAVVSPVQFPSQTGHSTQPLGDAPLSSPRTAMNAVRRLIVFATASPSSIHPVEFPGRRVAISTPSTPTRIAFANQGAFVERMEESILQSTMSRTKPATISARPTSPIPQARRTNRRSHSTVIKGTISTG